MGRGVSPDPSRQINHLSAGRVFGEGQGVAWARRRQPQRMRATYHQLKGTEQFLGFYDVQADCLSGVFRRRERRTLRRPQARDDGDREDLLRRASAVRRPHPQARQVPAGGVLVLVVARRVFPFVRLRRLPDCLSGVWRALVTEGRWEARRRAHRVSLTGC